MTVSEEQPTMLSEIRVTPVSSLVQSGDHGNNQKWLTKKKVEIVTTKNIEKTIQRQLVLEDGRVLDEDVPIVTLDTTENKEMFETDHDETRDNPAYNRRGDEMNIGDKVTTLKTTKDVKENVTKTEASQNIGSIASRDIAGILRDKSRLQHVMRRPARSGELAAVPVTVAASRRHRTVTDTRRVNERNFRTSGGNIQTEKIQTERHEVYESNDSETSDAESDFEKIEYEELVQEEPLEYKTKTEESFIEYFQKGQNKDKWHPRMVRGRAGEAESKHFSKNTSAVSVPRRQLQQSRSWDNDREDKLGNLALSKPQSNSLGDLSRSSRERVFIAKVIDDSPAVVLRQKKKQNISRRIEHRQSAGHLLSSRCSTPPSPSAAASREYHFPNCRVRDNTRERQRPMSLDISNKFFYSGPETVRKTEHVSRSSLQDYSRQKQQRHYHSSVDISEKPKQIEIKIEKTSGEPQRYSSTDNLLHKQICTKSLVKKGHKFQSVGDICFTTSKEIPAPSTAPASPGREVVIQTPSPRGGHRDRRSSGQLIFTSERQRSPLAASTPLERSQKTLSCTNLSTRVIPIELFPGSSSRPCSPATKYRTRVAVHAA